MDDISPFSIDGEVLFRLRLMISLSVGVCKLLLRCVVLTVARTPEPTTEASDRVPLITVHLVSQTVGVKLTTHNTEEQHQPFSNTKQEQHNSA